MHRWVGGTALVLAPAGEAVRLVGAAAAVWAAAEQPVTPVGLLATARADGSLTEAEALDRVEESLRMLLAAELIEEVDES